MPVFNPNHGVKIGELAGRIVGFGAKGKIHLKGLGNAPGGDWNE